ncbi:MAG: tetratricopeptide repeat protein, partial [Xanthomonadales bacterium]|nr:tetratricopeptide repeat protein [Xanthomonadales bacterium]
MADFFHEIKERRLLPAVGFYIGSSWVLVEILDRLVERYLLSPFITDIAFWGLFSLIPAVVLIAWTHGRPGKDEVTRVEKVGVSINLLVTLGLLVSAFGGKDLGATADLVTVQNEQGQKESHYVPRDSFRRRLAVFFFDQDGGSQETAWLRYGVTELLVQDLNESPFVNAASPWTNYGSGFYARMKREGFDDAVGLPRSLMRQITDDANRQYFISGSISQQDGEYRVRARIWDAVNLQEIASLDRSGWDLYDTVDALGEDVLVALDTPLGSGRDRRDLPLGETYGESLEPFRLYVAALNKRLFDNDLEASTRLLDQALQVDPDFVRAWFAKAFNALESGDLPSAQAAIQKTQELDYRLPPGDRANVKQLNYRLTGQTDKQIAYLRMQVQLRDDAQSHQTLAGYLMAAGELAEARDEYLAALARDPMNLDIYLQLANLEKGLGNMEGAIGHTRRFIELKPDDAQAHIRLGDLLRDAGELDEASAQYENAALLEDPPTTATLKQALISIRRGNVHEARGLVEQAASLAESPLEQGQVRSIAELIEFRLGRVRAAIEQLQRREAYLAETLPPFQVAVAIYTPLAQYRLELGDTEGARQALAHALETVQPPLDQFLAFTEASILTDEGSFDESEAA